MENVFTKYKKTIYYKTDYKNLTRFLTIKSWIKNKLNRPKCLQNIISKNQTMLRQTHLTGEKNCKKTTKCWEYYSKKT